jgi:putative copper export protein
MTTYGVALTLHLLGATVWTGGHLVLAIAILPEVLRTRSPALLRQFEERYERVGGPALLLQLATGLWLAWQLLPAPMQWLQLDNPVSRLIAAKLTLLALTGLIAIDTRLRIVPKLSERTLNTMAVRIVLVTLLAVAFVIVGASLRSGLLL